MSILDVLFKKSEPEAQPTLEEQHAQREAELRAERRALDAALDELYQMAREFVREHGCIVDGRSSWKVSDITERARLDAEFQNLSRAADRIIARRSVVLHELAKLTCTREKREPFFLNAAG